MNLRTAALLGRLAIGLGFLSLIEAWYTQLTGSDLLGMTQEHLFADATVLTLLGIAGLLDAQLHSQKI